jgi:thiol-disulfide isomerase/thioredoxin
MRGGLPVPMRAGLPLLMHAGRSVLVLAALGCSAAALGCAAAPARGPAAGVAGARDVTGIAIVGVDGASAPLGAVLARRPALVSFGAPWCEPCVRELPALERLARDAAACGAAVVGVAVGERADAIAEFSRARHLTYPQYADESFALADALGQRRIPATVVFDGAGKIVFAGDALDARAIAALAGAANNGGPPGTCALR